MVGRESRILDCSVKVVLVAYWYESDPHEYRTNPASLPLFIDDAGMEYVDFVAQPIIINWNAGCISCTFGCENVGNVESNDIFDVR